MPTLSLPPKDKLTIGFAHAAYQLGERFQVRQTGIAHFEVRNGDELKRRVAEADVLVVSVLWQNAMLEVSPRLRFVQSISAGINQYDQAMFAARTACGWPARRASTRSRSPNMRWR